MIHNSQDYKKSIFFLISIISIFMVHSVYGNTADSAAENQKFDDAKALDYIASTTGIPREQLTIGASSVVNFTLLNITVKTYKICDHSRYGICYPVTLDLYGNSVNKSELDLKTATAEQVKYKKLDPGLYDFLACMKAGDTVEVNIWLEEPPQKEFKIHSDDPSRRGDSPAYSLRWKDPEVAKRVLEAYAVQERPVIDFLKSKGATITHTSNLATVVVGANISADLIQSLNDIGVVRFVSLAEYHSCHNVAPTTSGNSVTTNIPTNETPIHVQGKVVTDPQLRPNQEWVFQYQTF